MLGGRGKVALAAVVAVLALTADAAAEHNLLELSSGPGVAPCPESSCFASLGPVNGNRVLFTTNKPLVPGDDNGTADLYLRDGETITQISKGPAGSGISGSVLFSRDGSRVIFVTPYRLVAEDDAALRDDIYEWSDGQLRKLTPVPLQTGSNRTLGVAGISEDGRHIAFQTYNSYVPEDTDVGTFEGALDLYEIVDGRVRLAVDGGIGATAKYSADASRLFFATSTQMVAADQDYAPDLYQRFNGEMTLLSTGPTDGADDEMGMAYFPEFAISRDGSRVYFVSSDTLVAEDQDFTTGGFNTCIYGEVDDYTPCDDLYERRDGTTRLISRPSACTSCDARLVSVSDDGSRVYFATAEPLLPEDQNGGSTNFLAEDYYRDVDGRLELVTAGPDGRAFGQESDITRTQVRTTPDGRHVILSSRVRLTPDDTDDGFDLFHRFDSTTELISTGPLSSGCCTSPNSVLARAVSDDGSRIFFSTTERLVAEDTNESTDLYERAGGQTTLISRNLGGRPRTKFEFFFPRISPDGRDVFFTAENPLLDSDTDTWSDVYHAYIQHPPDCSGVAASAVSLDADKHSFDPVTLSGATDPDGDPVTIAIDGVTQDEPVAGRTDNTSPDARRTGDGVELRAERNPQGDGRVYRIAFTASDGQGGSCTGTAKVGVPRDKKDAAVDSAPPGYGSL